MANDRKIVGTYHIPVRWGDMDALGHVNNSRYFTYLEQARIHWLAQLQQSVTSADPQGPVLINASCTFLKAVVYPATLIVKMFIGDLGRTSMMTYYDVSQESDPETCYAQGAGKIVWIDYKKNKPIALPSFIRDLMSDEPTQ